MTELVFQKFQLFGLSLHMLGNLLCLVMLCQKSMRRDKVCPQYRVFFWCDTNTVHTLQKLSGPLDTSHTMSPFFFLRKIMRSWSSFSGNTVKYPINKGIRPLRIWIRTGTSTGDWISIVTGLVQVLVIGIRIWIRTGTCTRDWIRIVPALNWYWD